MGQKTTLFLRKILKVRERLENPKGQGAARFAFRSEFIKNPHRSPHRIRSCERLKSRVADVLEHWGTLQVAHSNTIREILQIFVSSAALRLYLALLKGIIALPRQQICSRNNVMICEVKTDVSRKYILLSENSIVFLSPHVQKELLCLQGLRRPCNECEKRQQHETNQSEISSKRIRLQSLGQQRQ